MRLAMASYRLSPKAKYPSYVEDAAAALKATGNERIFQQLIKDRDHGSIAGHIAQPGDPAAEGILSFMTR